MTTATASSSTIPALVVTDLHKTYERRDRTKVNAIAGVSVTVDPGEFVVLLGPSGCGKTTLLRSVAGLVTPSTGSITVGGRTVFASEDGVDLPPERRSLNMMFQSYALWPHMTVAQNVAFPLSARKVPKSEIRGRVDEVLGLVGIDELHAQYPSQLSGGQQQRVALARALVSGDQLILFDEPLSNVDAKVREQLRFELIGMQKRLGFAAVYVTHDQQEAMELADRVVVLEDGRIAQDAPPAAVYSKPSSLYVANFIGTVNDVLGTVTSVSGDLVAVDTPLGPITGHAPEPVPAVHDTVTVIWRPENCSIVADGGAAGKDDVVWMGTVGATMFSGAHTNVAVQVGDHVFHVRSHARSVPVDGATVTVQIPRDAVLVMPTPAKADVDSVSA